MGPLREGHRAGLEYLETASLLLQRIRASHPTRGLFEAADLQWWWSLERSTDVIPQLFWFDEDGLPAAGVIATDWGGDVALAPMVMPDAPADWIAHVLERGLLHAGECGFTAVDLEVDRTDDVMRDLLTGHGFTCDEDGRGDTASVSVVEAWLDADKRPRLSPLREGYRLSSRVDTAGGPYHNLRGSPDIEPRLLQTSLYRPDLDLVIHDRDGNAAAYGLFWMDPTTSTGVVEPMRTTEGHQRRGLARHVLTVGVDRLASAGAERIKLVFEPDNRAAADLYLPIGFEAVKETVVYSGSLVVDLQSTGDVPRGAQHG